MGEIFLAVLDVVVVVVVVVVLVDADVRSSCLTIAVGPSLSSMGLCAVMGGKVCSRVLRPMCVATWSRGLGGMPPVELVSLGADLM